MGLKKGKGKLSPVKGEWIRGRSTENTDHWAFLVRVEISSVGLIGFDASCLIHVEYNALLSFNLTTFSCFLQERVSKSC